MKNLPRQPRLKFTRLFSNHKFAIDRRNLSIISIRYQTDNITDSTNPNLANNNIIIFLKIVTRIRALQLQASTPTGILFHRLSLRT